MARCIADVERRLAAYEPIFTEPTIVQEMQIIVKSGLKEQEKLPAIPPPNRKKYAGKLRRKRQRKYKRREGEMPFRADLFGGWSFVSIMKMSFLPCTFVGAGIYLPVLSLS